ncbi:MAG: protoporphyrinogen oxidase [Thermoguttaceae bacterium]|nr:protoporphyrinogen oxidase [Thermoguttaceae bacterium]
MPENNKSTCRRVAVIGAGISGLAAAFHIHELSPETSISVFDPRPRVGGVLNTVIKDGLEIEEGADNFITTVPWGLDLCKRLGISDQLVTTSSQYRQTFVVFRNRLHKLPEGFLMMAPTKMWPLATTRLLSPLGKIRAGLELFIPRKKDDADESMAEFGRRRLGKEVFERLIEPLVSGVYGANLEELSVLATMERFREMEKEHRSLIIAMRAEMAKRRKAARDAKAAAQAGKESGPRYSMFVTLKGGFSLMSNTIVEKLPSGTFNLNCRVTRLNQETSTSGRPVWRVTWQDGQDKPELERQTWTELFDAVIVAAPSYNAQELLAPINARLGELLGGIGHTGTAIASMAFKNEQIRHPMEGMGAVVPEIEHSPILAMSFSTHKYPHRSPKGTQLIRVFAGGARDSSLAVMPDEQLTPLLVEKMRPLLKIEGPPYAVHTAHWPNTMPQYYVGHLDRVAEIEQIVGSIPGLALAGNSYRGVGVPACIHSGEQAAEIIRN